MNSKNENATVLQSGRADKEWWRGAVIYQIYPRSFQDTSGDGIGDINGITSRLAYVSSLGVDAIWISPFFTSPMRDYGYDVSDYKGVDPMFGTLHDFDMLIAEAHCLGLKVMIDLVISHTSNQHPWFVESRSSRNNPKADWYVWADAKPDGTPPNNWLSIFGGSAWQWDPTRCQYFLHNFLAEQPDLNFHNEEVQDSLLDIARFWLERGVDGFRLDTINFYFHDRQLRDNPPLAPELRNYSTAPEVNPYNHQDHIYDKSRPENLGFLKRLRSLMEEFPAIAAVGEVGDALNGLKIVADYTSGGDKMHMCYAFDFLSGDVLSPSRIAKVIADFTGAAPEGWACWAFSNHDVTRHSTRWRDGVKEHDFEQYLRVLSGLLLSLRGSVCLYQGEELGLTEADIAFEDLRDPYGIEFWPDYKGRDGCRTPMVWEHERPNAGFTTGQPWLPVPPEHRVNAVDVQDHRHASILNHYRHFLAFRKKHPELVRGEMEIVSTDDDVLVFNRRLGNETIACMFNFAAEERFVDRPTGDLTPLEGHGFSGWEHKGKIELPPYNAFFARIS